MAPHDFAILTQSSFESGITASKWITLCQLLREKQTLEERAHAPDAITSNAILALLASYPADPTLLDYLRHAIQDGFISLPTYVATFLQATLTTADLQVPSTIEALCRVATALHYSSGNPPLGSIVPLGDTSASVLERLRDSFSLLQIACSFRPPHFEGVTSAVSELASLVLSCVDVIKINLNDSMLLYSQVNAIGSLPLPPLLLEQLSRFDIALNLNIMDKSDKKSVREGPVAHDVAISLGSGIVAESLPDTDLSTCTLVLQHLVNNMGTRFGPGNTGYGAATLSGLYRWTSWPLATFYRQFLISNFKYLAQLTASAAREECIVRQWSILLIGRLPMLLHKINVGETLEFDWRRAFQEGLISAFNHHEILDVCNQGIGVVQGRNFTSRFLARLANLGCIESSLVASLDPSTPPPDVSRLAQDAAAAGVPVMSFIENRLFVIETGYEELEDFVMKNISCDHEMHAPFAEAITRRLYTLFSSMTTEGEGLNPVFGGTEAERLGCLLRLFYEQDVTAEILAIYTDLERILGIMTVWERCDLDSDPQTSVQHLGHLVLFMQATAARYKLSIVFPPQATRGSPGVYLDAAHIMQPDKMTEEDKTAYTTWKTALFAVNSNEGIGDASFSAARPICFLRIAPTLVSNAISDVIKGAITLDVLREGLSYFCGPLFNWTLVGVIKALLIEFQQSGFQSTVHFEVLETFVMTKTIPKPVLQLCAPAILRTFSEGVTQRVQGKGQFDLIPLRKRALHALGLTRIIDNDHVPPNFDGPKVQFSSTGRTTVDLAPPPAWTDQPAQHLRDALSAIQAGRAPALAVSRCLLVAPPVAFVHTLFDVLVHAAGVGTPITHCRALATVVLVLPVRGSRALPAGTHPQARTLLPVFLHAVLPRLLVLLDEPASLAADPTTRAELLVAVVASALTAALHLERAYSGMANATPAPEEHAVPAPANTVAAMARRLAEHLREAAEKSHSASLLLQRLAAMPAFTANFPMFVK